MQLFVTYARESVAEVQKLAEILGAGGHSVWFDDQLMPGEDWKQELGEAIERCDAYLYALSSAALESDWCQWEFATAVRLHKPVIPMLLEPEVSLPQALERLQYADFTQGVTPLSVAKLMGALGSMQRVPDAETPPVPADPQGTPSRAWEDAKHWTDIIIPTQHQPQSEEEELLGKFAVNLWRGLEGVGGRLLITNQRLMFEAHKLNLQRKPLAIPMSEITEAFPSKSLGLFSNGLTIRCRSGDEYRFVVGKHGEKIVSIIEQHARLAG